MSKSIRHAIPPETGLRINRTLLEGDGDDLLDILADLIGKGALIVTELALERFMLAARCAARKEN